MIPYNKKLVSNAGALRRNMTDEEKRLWYDFLKKLPPKWGIVVLRYTNEDIRENFYAVKKDVLKHLGVDFADLKQD